MNDWTVPVLIAVLAIFLANFWTLCDRVSEIHKDMKERGK